MKRTKTFEIEIKEKIVREGGSTVYESWHKVCGITMEDFIDGLRWLCEDPMTDGHPTRELGCKRGDSRLHRLTRVYTYDGPMALYDEDGHIWGGTQDYASFNARDRI